MDEPFGPLDAQTRQIMGNLLLDLWSADRKAVMFVTHDLEEAIALSDRVVIMSAGPAARIIGNWTVPLRAPARHRRGEARSRLPRAAPRDLGSAEGRSDEGLSADGRRVMNRATLLTLQILVAVVCDRALARAHEYPICGLLVSWRENDCGRAAAVLLLDAARCRLARCEMVLRGHDLEAPVDHADRGDARLRHRLARRRADRLLVRAQADGQRGVRPLREDAQRAAARRAGADLRAVVRARHRVEGRARLHAGVLHRVLQRLSGREGSQPDGARRTRACSA